MPLPDPSLSDVERGDLVYRLDEDMWVVFRATDIRYSTLDSLSRVQLKILGVYLSELQDQIRRRMYDRNGLPLDPPPYPTTPSKETPDGTA